MASTAPSLNASVTKSGPVTFTQQGENMGGELLITLAPKATFSSIKSTIIEQLTESNPWEGKFARIDMDSRLIDLFELQLLKHMLSDSFKITVEALNCSHDALTAFAESGLKLKVHPRTPVDFEKQKLESASVKELVAPALLEVPNETVVIAEEHDGDLGDGNDILIESPSLGDSLNQSTQTDNVLTLKKSLRSGQRVRFAGDVVVYGDINAGAEILAGGNIIILGSLRGLAHAGARGDDGATVVAFDFRPTQLRIGRKFAEPTEWSPRFEKSYSPSIASVHGGEVIVKAYSGQSHR